MREYLARIFQSRLFDPGFEDVCLASLSTGGAARENMWVTTLPSVFYYSVSNRDTVAVRDFRLQTYAFPRVHSMLLALQPLAMFLGGKFPLERGFDAAWQPNDGVVNTISMVSDGHGAVIHLNAPPQASQVKQEGEEEEEEANDRPPVSRRGCWHHLGTLETMDHAAVLGFKVVQACLDLYVAHAQLLYDLPPHEQLHGLRHHPMPRDVVAAIRRIVRRINTGPTLLQELFNVAEQEEEAGIDRPASSPSVSPLEHFKLWFRDLSVTRAATSADQGMARTQSWRRLLVVARPGSVSSASSTSLHRRIVLQTLDSARFLLATDATSHSQHHQRDRFVRSSAASAKGLALFCGQHDPRLL